MANLLLLQVFIEHVQWQWSVGNAVEQILQVVDMTSKLANGTSLSFDEFFFNIVGDLEITKYR